jgi:signal transduction histidine kinase
MYRRSGPLTTPVPICAGAPRPPGEAAFSLAAPPRGEVGAAPNLRRTRSGPETELDDGLLHDVRNLMGAIGLYCDLLSMPDVLKPEHRRYAEELRLLGTRSGALIQHLMQHQMHSSPGQGGSDGLGAGASWEAGVALSLALAKVRAAEGESVESAVSSHRPVSLRTIVERCSGLLSQVAGGRVIEVSYGAAASQPVSVDEESVERILVNLVSNSAAAMRGPERTHGAAGDAMESAARGTVLERIADRTADETPGAIRIGVGVLINRVDDPKPWPLRRVRLTVEDSGCGMNPEQIERILSGYRAPARGRRGIGFRVVRELVAASAGDLRVMSAPGIGTRVQIEWPVTTISCEDAAGKHSASRGATAMSQLAAASGLPRAGRARRGSHRPEGLCAVEAVALPGSDGDSATGDGKCTVC